MNQPAHIRSASWFTIVGALAALVHYLSAIILESLTSLSPGSANLFAFLLAFPVSYFGHRSLSFRGSNSLHRAALPRFLIVACTGFAVNQLMLLSLLKHTSLPFWLVLGAVMVIVALGTYLLSRYWAFSKKD